MIENLPKDIADKLPSVEQFNKNRGGSVSYIFMLIFFLYFFYNEFIKRDDCGEKIATFETVITQKDAMITTLNERVTRLEEYIDIKNGVIKKVEEKVASITPDQIGGFK